MVNVLEMYELDLELSYRLVCPTTIEKALKDQGLSAMIAEEIIQLCETREFQNAARLAVESGCDFKRLNDFLEKNAMERKSFPGSNV